MKHQETFKAADFYRDQRIAFENGLSEWENTDRKNRIKIKKKWTDNHNRLTQDRGIWEIESSDNVIKFKIDKAEDSLRRRMRLRKDHKAPFRQYLSATAF